MRKLARAVLWRLRRIIATEEERRHSLVGSMTLWKMKRDFQIEYLKSVGLKPDHYLLDLGCGTLRGGIPIITYLQKGHYVGIESRKHILDEGKKELLRYDLKDKEPQLILSDDIATITLNINFDFIWAFSVLIHMEDKILNDCLDFVQRHLKNSGFFYANMNIGEQENGSWQGFPVVWRSLDFCEELGSHHGLIVTDMGTLESLGHLSGSISQDSQRMIRFNKEK
jgi:cyclopropane fatty-acyl-phospholipid synthase-like methyltransferase